MHPFLDAILPPSRFLFSCSLLALLVAQGRAVPSAEEKQPPAPTPVPTPAPKVEVPAAKEPSFETLLELNAAQVFGGEVQVKGDRVTIRFPGKGLFSKGFRVSQRAGKGFVSDLAELREPAVKKAITDGIDAFSCAGLDSGTAVSIFEMAGDVSIRFRLKTASILFPAQFTVFLHDRGPRNRIQTNFFQEIVATDNGKVLQAKATNERYAASPARWWDAKSRAGVPVEIAFKDDRVAVSLASESGPPGPPGDPRGPDRAKEKGRGGMRKGMGRGRDRGADSQGGLEVVSLDGIAHANRGKIRFEFQRMTLCMADLVIEGTYDRKWAESCIAKLRSGGKLLLQAPVPGAGPSAPEAASGTAVKKRRLEAGKLDEPDPHAGEEL